MTNPLIEFLGRVFAIGALLVPLSACSSTPNPNPLTCAGGSCACPMGDRCRFNASNCGVDGGSCSLSCESTSTCSGSCGESCSVACANGSTCSPTLGASGSVSCTSGATCHVTCTGSCSVSCSGATCDLTCPGASAPTVLSGGGSCP